MKNYISLNGTKIELTAEQVAEMTKSLKAGQVLKDIPEGEAFKIGDYEFIVLERSRDTTAVILKNLLYEEKRFGDNNNYENSNIDAICCTFGRTIEKAVGAGNLIKHTVDLTSDDGLKDYGKVQRYMSLLTTELYRRYVEILDNYKIGKWWWLATAYSTPTHEHTSWVKCVSPSGNIGGNNFSSGRGVRPFLKFVSSIFVSCED